MAIKFFNAVLPSVPRTEDRQQLQFLSAIKQALDELKNNFVISDQGIVAKKGSDAASDDLTAGTETDLTAFSTPSAPTGVEAIGAIENIVLEWSYSGAPIGKFEIWRSLTDDFGQAELRGVTEALVFLDGVGPGSTFYYWVRGVSTGGVEGPFQGVNGVEGSTADDPISVLADVSDGVKESNLAQALLGNIPNLAGTPGVQTNLDSAVQTLNGTITSVESSLQSSVDAVDGTVDSLYTLRVNNNGKVTGFGLSNDGTESSFGVLADRFFIVNQDNQGQTLTPFVVQGGQVFINSATIADASITSAQIASLAADKITAANLSAISANLGSITAGSLAGPNDRFKIDLANNRLEVFDEGGTLRVRIGDI